MSLLNTLLSDIESCTLCDLPNGHRPVLSLTESCKILVVGQAPGIRVHQTGIPWNDPSGDRLRQWMGLDKPQFYDSRKIAIVPMAFCYPGKGKSGDLPPDKTCSQTWFPKLKPYLRNIELTILAGSYAQNYYLKNSKKSTLTSTVETWKHYLPNYIVLPHPSPRNTYWIQQHPWFEETIIPYLKKRIQALI